MEKYHCKIIGFTLIELLVTLVVLGILMAIGTSSYSSLLSQQTLLHKTERLYHFLRLAKSQSIKDNKQIYVRFCPLDNSGAWKVAMTYHSLCDCLDSASCLLNGVEVSENLSDGKTLSIIAADLNFADMQASYSPMRFSVISGSVTFTDTNGDKLKVKQGSMRLSICSPTQNILGYKKCP